MLAGATSMFANAAGPIMMIYLLTMRLDKKELIGTGAWFFWAINLLKIPFSSNLGLITGVSLSMNILLLPCIVFGGVLGIMFVHRISQRIFNLTVEILAAATAIYLCVRPWL